MFPAEGTLFPAEGKMSLTGHLSELRNRLVGILVSTLAGFAVCFGFSEELLGFVTLPLKKDVVFVPSYPFMTFADKSVPVPNLVFLAPAEAFWMHFKIAMVFGIILVLPYVLFQVWKFISPGLLPSEKKYAAPFILAATAQFLIGSAFCMLIVLPFAMRFLLTYKTEHLTPMLSVGNYVDFVLKFALAFGAVFELPLVIIIVTRMGIVSADSLARNRKYAVLVAFIVAAILTPTPDAFNQTLMAVPMIVLFEGGLFVARLLARGKD